MTVLLLLPELSDTSVCCTEGTASATSRLKLLTWCFQPDVQVCDLTKPHDLMGLCCWTGKGKEPQSPEPWCLL